MQVQKVTLADSRSDRASQTGAPTVLPCHAHEVEVVACACRDSFARVELERIVSVDRKRHGPPDTPVLLKIAVQHSVDSCSTAGEVCRGERSPGPRAKA